MLTENDFAKAAERLGCTVAQIRAVDEVESGGGWFTDVRAEILALDGPGGFLDGVRLPKILFEAHIFSRETGGRYDASHPDISSPAWNRSLYIGGQREYERLHRAMTLQPTAAMRSASWGRYQIMGFNHRLAGYPDVFGFADAMKDSEALHLQAFVSFIRASGMQAAVQAISTDPAACREFARRYNGTGYEANGYHTKLAAAYRKHAGNSPEMPDGSRPTLRLGASGPAVRDLQAALNRLMPHRQPLAVDGVFGAQTEMALLAWQGRNGLLADGVAGAKTWASLGDPPPPPDLPDEYDEPEPASPGGFFHALAAAIRRWFR